MYTNNSQIKFKNSMLPSSLFDYCDACILVKETITAPNTAVAPAAANNGNKKVIFKNFVPSTDCVSEINTSQVNNATDINVVMSMYN